MDFFLGVQLHFTINQEILYIRLVNYGFPLDLKEMIIAKSVL